MDEQIFHELNRIARELTEIRKQVSDCTNYIRRAEAEVPEHFRRFANYIHDLHSVKYMYEEQGQSCPQHVLREMERCDDRFRQLIKAEHTDGGAFEKVRREMAADPDNRWDHTRLLYPPQTNGG